MGVAQAYGVGQGKTVTDLGNAWQQGWRPNNVKGGELKLLNEKNGTLAGDGVSKAEVKGFKIRPKENESLELIIENNKVGSAKLSKLGYLGYDIKVPKNLRGQGYNSAIIGDVIQYYNKSGIEVKGIKGKWISSNDYEGGMSTNLKVFIDEYIHNNKTFQEAAFSTPAGKVAKENGFTKATLDDWDVLEIGSDKPVQIYWMELKFK